MTLEECSLYIIIGIKRVKFKHQLSREEGQTFDRKSVRIKSKDLAVTMIAFANADGMSASRARRTAGSMKM